MGAMTLLHASCTEYLIVCIFCSFRLGHGYGVPDGRSTVVFGPLRRSSALLWEPRATLVAIPPTSEYFFFSIPKIPIISLILNLFETATSTSSRVSSGLRRPARSRWRCVSSLGLLCPLAASQTDVLDSTGTALPRWIRPPPPPRRRQAVQWVFSLSI